MSSLWIFPIAIGAGALGSMLGLGGGIILVPALTVLMGVPIKQAVVASLVAVAATSCAGASNYLQAGLVDWRLGVRLLIPTLCGAIAGGLLIGYIPESAVRWLFIALVLYVLGQMLWTMRHPTATQRRDPTAARTGTRVSGGLPSASARWRGQSRRCWASAAG